MLDEQRRHYETKVKQLTKRVPSRTMRPEEWEPLSEADIPMARRVVKKWRSLTRVRMAEVRDVHCSDTSL